MRAKPVGRMRKRKRWRRRRRIISQTRPSPSSTSRMRIRCLVRIRYNECTVALKAGEDNHRHETLDDERLALRTLDSQEPATMIDPRYRNTVADWTARLLNSRYTHQLLLSNLDLQAAIWCRFQYRQLSFALSTAHPLLS